MIGHLYQEVFPARAGMIRDRLDMSGLHVGIPRESGDDPWWKLERYGPLVYSPRERG